MRWITTTTTLLTLAALLAAPTPALAGDTGADADVAADMAHEIVHLKHIHPNDAERALRPFTSRHGRLDANPSLGTLTIVDEPALVRKMLEVIAEIDVPRQEWSFQILLVYASDTGAKGIDVGPLETFDGVAEELTSLFQYDLYEELDRSLIKVTDGNEASLQLGGDPGYRVDLLPMARGEDRVSVDFHLYRPETIVRDNETTTLKQTIVATTFEARPGDTTVVGASRLNGDEKALITIVQTRPSGG